MRANSLGTLSSERCPRLPPRPIPPPSSDEYFHLDDVQYDIQSSKVLNTCIFLVSIPIFLVNIWYITSLI